MKKQKYISENIRESFRDFFKNHNHIEVPSSSLIPRDDPTLLFTNSGMVQFKNYFTGKELIESEITALLAREANTE